MPTLESTVRQKIDLEPRRDVAVTALSERAGVEPPVLPGGKWPQDLDAAMVRVGDLATTVFLLEVVQALAAELDALKDTISAPTTSPSPTTKGAKER